MSVHVEPKDRYLAARKDLNKAIWALQLRIGVEHLAPVHQRLAGEIESLAAGVWHEAGQTTDNTTKVGPPSAMAERGRRGGESSDRVGGHGDGGS